MIIAAIGVRISSPGPIFFRQIRVGKMGKKFMMLKFRSMRVNSLSNKGWTTDTDSRKTKFGNFIRKTSIDELPQLFNVLLGDMSLVGPRPLVEGELEKHQGLTLYNKVRPGVTGWWACNGRSNISYRERLELEYYYVKNCSLYLDALCLFRTFFAVINRDGAQ
jgi:undecaprenyl-phosphate galactose phosphotransferase